MESKQRFVRVVLTVILAVIVAGASLVPQPAQASYEDAAIFYDELSAHGSWVEYDKYGPVWYPRQVEEDWRPYSNGRWTPSEQGYLFETDEPWGWATYHYGNWMPTENYGWVWVPGRTWYPNTVAWRNSPENAPVDTSYIGWAPIPPPNYVPPPAYAQPGYAPPPPGYYGGGGYPGYGGYGPGGSVLDLLAAPFWIFAQASRFLLGFGQPYAPGYSYYGCGCLAPPTYYPMIYPATAIISSWYYPSYYRPALFGGGLGLGAYSWGPPVTYVSRVTNINNITINNYIKNVHINNVRGGWPDRVVFNRNPNLRKIVPSENPRNWSKPMRVRNVDAAVRHLGNPQAIVQPAGLKPLDRTRIPKATTAAVTGDRPTKFRGMELPKRAQQQVTPQMQQRLQKLGPAAAQGPAGRGPGARGRGQVVGPEGVQKGVVGGPEGARRMGRGQPEGVQGQRGVRKGPGEGPETSKGVRRGPQEGFQGPAARGVRRGPAEPSQGAQGVRRGPREGFQGPGQASQGRTEGVQRPGQAKREMGTQGTRGPGRATGPTGPEGFQKQRGQTKRGQGPQGVQGPSRGQGPSAPQQRQPATKGGKKAPPPEGTQGPGRGRRDSGPQSFQGPSGGQSFSRSTPSRSFNRGPEVRSPQASGGSQNIRRAAPGPRPQTYQSNVKRAAPAPQTVKRSASRGVDRSTRAKSSSQKTSGQSAAKQRGKNPRFPDN